MQKAKDIRLIITLIGSLLILINAAWIAAQGKAIIISTYPASLVSELTSNWGRIVFGMPTLVSGSSAFIWVAVAAVNLALVIMLFLRPRREQLVGIAVLILSLSSIAVGGGFLLGIFLAIVGISPVVEGKPMKETFLGKILRSMRFDSALYEGIEKNPDGIRAAFLTIVFLNILTGFGNGLYVQCVRKIFDPTLRDVGENILIRGVLPLDVHVMGIIGTYIGVGVIKWLLLSLIMYFVLTKITLAQISFQTTARIVAFAYAPIALQLFLPFVLFNQPILTGTWPLTIFFISNLWMGIAFAFAIGKASDISRSQSFAASVLGGTMYYTVNSIFMTQAFALPAISIVLQPIELLEGILTVGIILSFLLGVFTQHK